jgi:hypothetical protein
MKYFGVENERKEIVFVADNEFECNDYIRFMKDEGPSRAWWGTGGSVVDVGPGTHDHMARGQYVDYEAGYDAGCDAPEDADRYPPGSYSYVCGYRAGLSDRGAYYRRKE